MERSKFFPRGNRARFFEERPALFLGFLLLTAAACALKPSWQLFCLVPFFLSFVTPRYWAATLSLMTLFGLYALWRAPGVPQAGHNLEITSLRPSASPFGKRLLVEAKMGEGKVLISLPEGKFRPRGDGIYRVQGSVVNGERGTFFKPKRGAHWEEVGRSRSLAEIRFQMKGRVKGYLEEKLGKGSEQQLFSTLITGDIEERELKLSFARAGLQHLLAISGFHFALFAAFLGGLLYLLLPRSLAQILLLSAMTLYYLFLGDSPSVERAYVAISLYITSQLIRRPVSGWNALGVGLIVELFHDPTVLQSLAFNLSFLATAALLLGARLMEQFLQKLLPRRTLPEALRLTPLSQAGFILTTLLRKALALNLAVHLMTLPVLLFLFQRFPLHSLLYNLFIPPLLALALSLLFCALLIPLPFLFTCAKGVASLLLALSADIPPLLDTSLSCPFPLEGVLLILLLFFEGALLLQRDLLPKHEIG